MSGPFDWSDPEAVVVPEQVATAVYFNAHDDIVIRQLSSWDQDEDTWLVLTPDNAVRVARRMLELAGALSGGQTALLIQDGEEGREANTPNAERQRRYRERKRNAVTPTVTQDRNAPTVTGVSRTAPAPTIWC